MSNPFDQFASDVQAALPPSAPRFGAPGNEGYNPYAAPPPAQPPQPIMNNPMPPMGQQPPPYGGGYPGSYGAPPAPYGGASPSYSQMPPSNPPPNAYGSAPPPPQGFGAPSVSGGTTSSGGYMQGAPPPDGSPYMSQPPSYGQPGPAQALAPPPVPPMSQPGSDPYSNYGPPPPAAAAPAPMYGGYPPSNSAFEPPMSKDASVSNGSANPFDDTLAYSAPAPAPGGYGSDPYMAPPGPTPGGYANDPYMAPPGPAPGGYGSDPYMAPPPAGAPVAQNMSLSSLPAYGGAPYGNEPWNAPPPGAPQPPPAGYPPQPDPMAGALVPSQQAPSPYGQQFYGQPYPTQQPPPAPAPPSDPFAVFQGAPRAIEPAPMNAGPPVGDPFGGTMVVHSAPAPTAADIFAEMGFAPAAPDPQPAPVVTESEQPKEPVVRTVPQSEGELPPGGEWYDAKIFTPTLGVMFFKPQELTDSLFLNTERDLVDNLKERPVVAFIVEGSSARSAGVELGHVLLKVNGVDVKNPKEASRLIKEGPRPLPLLFYVPNTEVVTAEGEHMVKYDTRETTAPPSAKDWKPKYVVIGGIIAQPWMINMYRSKSEYDIAVIETQARRAVSVKVKQFSLQGARILNDWQGPQMVKYKNKLHPWKYIVVLPVARNPIKISSPNLSSLKPVHEGIRRVLLTQQRDRGSGPNPYATPTRDPYASSPARDPYASSPARDPYAREQQQNGHGREEYGSDRSNGSQGGYDRSQGGYNGSQGGYDGPQGGGPPQQQRPQDPFFSGRY